MRRRRLTTAVLCASALLASTAVVTSSGAAAPGPSPQVSTAIAAAKPAAKKPAARPKPATVKSPNSYAARLVQLTNRERTKARRKPLRLQACLVRGAQAWSTQMARSTRFDHQHLGWVGSRCGFHRIYGENIAAGYRTPEQMMAAWMASPGHRRNLLNPAYTHLGIGYTSANGGYATQDFAG